MFKKLLFIIIAGLLLCSLAFGQDTTAVADITVEELVLCTGVEEKQPVDADTVFTNDVGRVYCFSTVVGVTEATSVFHVYYHNDVEMSKIELNINGTPWRTWSYKTIMESWIGDWKVEVVDADGKVLKTAKFKIKKAAM